MPKLFNRLLNILRVIKSKFMHLQWRLYVSDNMQGIEKFDFRKFKEIKPPKHAFWADPFLVQNNSKTFIFFEEMDFNVGRGHICVGELTAALKLINIKPILKKEYHLSFPFVFVENESYYMIPECFENKTIDLYESINFPYEWKFKKTLIDNIEASDTVVLSYNLKWWLFTCTKNTENKWSNLCIYYADTLYNQWMPHSLNPVNTKLETARMGGRIHLLNGKLMRISQDCSTRYGFAINISEIEELTEHTYNEVLKQKITPQSKSILGHHQLDWLGKIVVIDGERYGFKYF